MRAIMAAVSMCVHAVPCRAVGPVGGGFILPCVLSGAAGRRLPLHSASSPLVSRHALCFLQGTTFFFFFFLLPPGATEALSLSQQENSLDQLVTATSSCTTVEYHTRSCDVVRFFYRTISSLYCQFRIFTNYNYVNCMIASWGERGQR